MTRLERERNDSEIERFVRDAEDNISPKTARKYGDNLLKMTDALNATIDILARDAKTRAYVVEHMGDFFRLSQSVKNEYKSSFNKYCEFRDKNSSGVRCVMDSCKKPYSLIRVNDFEEFRKLFLSGEKFSYRREDGDRFIFRGQGDVT